MRTWQISKVVLLLAVTASLGLPAAAAEEKVAKADKPARNATSPEEAVKFALEAARAGDVDGFLFQMAAGPRELMKAQVAMMELGETWEDALNNKFGPDPNSKRKPFSAKDYLKTIQSMEIVSQDPKEIKDAAKVKLKIKTTRKEDGKESVREEEMTAVKEGGSWKLIEPHTETDPEKIKKAKKEMEDDKVAVEKVIKEVKDGKYKTRAEAEKAIQEALFKKGDQPVPE